MCGEAGEQRVHGAGKLLFDDGDDHKLSDIMVYYYPLSFSTHFWRIYSRLILCKVAIC